eukprot:snap_masked-scaffold_41-processed-gene-1.11-mRNA-1 protein AED:0.96 eAED:1.00 QI:0/-1/0/1/-1/1/1/0/367
MSYLGPPPSGVGAGGLSKRKNSFADSFSFIRKNLTKKAQQVKHAFTSKKSNSNLWKSDMAEVEPGTNQYRNKYPGRYSGPPTMKTWEDEEQPFSPKSGRSASAPSHSDNRSNRAKNKQNRDSFLFGNEVPMPFQEDSDVQKLSTEELNAIKKAEAKNKGRSKIPVLGSDASFVNPRFKKKAKGKKKNASKNMFSTPPPAAIRTSPPSSDPFLSGDLLPEMETPLENQISNEELHQINKAQSKNPGRSQIPFAGMDSAVSNPRFNKKKKKVVKKNSANYYDPESVLRESNLGERSGQDFLSRKKNDESAPIMGFQNQQYPVNGEGMSLERMIMEDPQMTSSDNPRFNRGKGGKRKKGRGGRMPIPPGF